jgi:hypothetical protein
MSASDPTGLECQGNDGTNCSAPAPTPPPTPPEKITVPAPPPSEPGNPGAAVTSGGVVRSPSGHQYGPGTSYYDTVQKANSGSKGAQSALAATGAVGSTVDSDGNVTVYGTAGALAASISGSSGSSPLNLGGGYSGRVDSFNGPGGQSSLEIHVYDAQGDEVGVWGSSGWINKHGGVPENVSPDLENTLRGMSIGQLRARGLIPPKGRADIRGLGLQDLISRFLSCAVPFGLFITPDQERQVLHRESSGGSL